MGREYRDSDRRDNDRRDNDRHDRRRRYRSRSASRDRKQREDEEVPSVARLRTDLSPERARSREREMRRRRMQTECIRRAGGFQRLADSEGRDPVRLVWDGFQWVAKTGSNSALNNDPALMNSTRKLRRLYFGNLPLHMGLTETAFQELVWEEMKRRGFCNDPNVNPVLCVWFAKDKGTYGFVEFATVDETERALTMDGMECMGVNLKVSRPNDYTTITNPQSKAMALIGQQSAQVLLGSVETEKIGSRFVRFTEICPERDIKDSEESWSDVLDDVCEGCNRWGRIRKVIIIAPELLQARPPGLIVTEGDVFFEFETPAAADMCVSGMSGRKYNGRVVQAEKIQKEQFDMLDHMFSFAKTVKGLCKTDE